MWPIEQDLRSPIASNFWVSETVSFLHNGRAMPVGCSLRAFHGRDRIRYVMKETKFPKDLIHMRQAGLFHS
jgi:hypothetical protein